MCFSVEWFVQLLIILVILCGAIAILRIWVFPLLASADARIPATLNIIIWVAVCIFVIYVVAYLLMCAVGGFVGMPRVR
jgi:hypothetical protein